MEVSKSFTAACNQGGEAISPNSFSLFLPFIVSPSFTFHTLSTLKFPRSSALYILLMSALRAGILSSVCLCVCRKWKLEWFWSVHTLAGCQSHPVTVSLGSLSTWFWGAAVDWLTGGPLCLALWGTALTKSSLSLSFGMFVILYTSMCLNVYYSS